MSEWDGRPENPERAGWHWIADKQGRVLPMDWNGHDPGARHHWIYGWRGWTAAEMVALGRCYLGPCRTPAEVAEMVAAAERRGMERAMDAAHDAIHSAIYEMTECSRVKAEVDGAIRAAMQEGQSDA